MPDDDFSVSIPIRRNGASLPNSSFYIKSTFKFNWAANCLTGKSPKAIFFSNELNIILLQ